MITLSKMWLFGRIFVANLNEEPIALFFMTELGHP